MLCTIWNHLYNLKNVKKLPRGVLRLVKLRAESNTSPQVLFIFSKIFKGQSPEYLFRILPSVSKAYNTRPNTKIPLFSGKYNFS